MTDPDDRFPCHPGLTIKVYKLDPLTGERRTIRTTTVQPEPHGTRYDLGRYPPCRCPRCRAKPGFM